ncbi:hypothetical protein CB0940_04477 [Cercospora beticola]|uniref:Uncharacterized protein n=1 Tax=Cercospora beticola TaxID=122368 RepID=A0A2G5HJE4_CERBT|nr:hypothetical protein CB0940_04477 [Cercospora beticola]PIA92650.1 hypothetical protein CB0940_04477 [Cercospora beticola]
MPSIRAQRRPSMTSEHQYMCNPQHARNSHPSVGENRDASRKGATQLPSSVELLVAMAVRNLHGRDVNSARTARVVIYVFDDMLLSSMTIFVEVSE